MSTLSGSVSKGEKSKPKFQVLDINSLYRHSRGENTEKTTQKSSSINIRHGMQSLGKVPNARRAPANLPSLKSEHSGSDAAVPLVPPGAPPGWGKQEATGSGSGTTPTSSSATVPPATCQSAPPSTVPPSQAQASAPQQPPQLTPHQAAIAIPVSPNAPPTHSKQMPPSAQNANNNSDSKLWSTVMSSGGPHHGHLEGGPAPPHYQSPQFQHEFPSLSAGDGGAGGRAPADTAPYASGLSLRPQTEGSWTQGGHQRGAEGPGGVPGGRPMGAPPQLQGPPGSREPPQAPFPPQIRGVMPSFMYKGSFPQGAPVGQNIGIPQQQQTANVNVGPPLNGGRPNRQMDGRPPRLQDVGGAPLDELSHRPIIKEEELTKLDEIAQDVGWAASDDVDYNEKLNFSDDEGDSKSGPRGHKGPKGTSAWNARGGGGPVPRGRPSDDEEMRIQRRTQQDKEVELAVQRAKQRKEEEEKRFQDEKARAAKKLLQLNEKIREKRDRNRESEVGTMNPAVVPPKPINHVEIPLPDFQKEKEERDTTTTRSRTPNETKEESSFRQLTQIEGKSNFQSRKQQPPNQQNQQKQDRDRDREHRGGEQNGPSFSRQFQNDMPPRFQRQQRGNSSGGGGGNSAPSHPGPPSYHQYDNNRWQSNQQQQQQNPMTTSRSSLEDVEDNRRDYKRQQSNHEDGGYGAKQHESNRYEDRHHSSNRHSFHEEDHHQNAWQQKDNKTPEKKEYADDRRSSQEKNERCERPPRTDSRDSFSRRSRDSEPREYMTSWSESMETVQCYEEKRREERRQLPAMVPGPITKERIEADEVIGGDKRSNLTQLKRGDVATAKRPEQPKKEESDAWVDSIPPLEEVENLAEKTQSHAHQQDNKPKEFQNVSDSLKQDGNKNAYHHHHELNKKDDYNKDGNRHSGSNKNNRNYSSQQNTSGSRGGWGGPPSGDYHSSRNASSWGKRGSSNRVHKPPSRDRDYFGGPGTTDSDGSSVDTQSVDSKGGQSKKFSVEKEEKNRENKLEKANSGNDLKGENKKESSAYVPRGEPSRHGRGGGNFRGGNRMGGGMSKRIDGYGPPPSKSPFGHPDDREHKKTTCISTDDVTSGTPQPSAADTTPPVIDKTKQNQEALAAGLIGKNRVEEENANKNKLTSSNNSKTMNNVRTENVNKNNKPLRTKEDESNSEHSDGKDSAIRRGSNASSGMKSSSRDRPLGGRENSGSGQRGRHNAPPPPRLSDKRYDGAKKPNEALVNDANPNIKKEEVDDREEKGTTEMNGGDFEGFQEVKSKKNVKERSQSKGDDKKPLPKTGVEINKEPLGNVARNDRSKSGGNMATGGGAKSNVSQMTPLQIQNIPSLMATPVNPPQVLPQPKMGGGGGGGGGQFEMRQNRQNKLAPRFAKQKLQKAQMQQQQNMMVGGEDLTKNLYGGGGVKEMTSSPGVVNTGCAWDKPLTQQLRTPEHENVLGAAMEGMKLEQTVVVQGGSPNPEKMMPKSPQLQDKTLLDGSTPPVNTIIFENTNFKTAPGARAGGAPNKQQRMGVDVMVDENGVLKQVKIQPAMEHLLQNKTPDGVVTAAANSKADPIQLPVLFKEDTSDMKLDFFGSDLTHLTDDKTTKTLCMSKSMTICNTDSLNLKIASVKKVWETSEQETDESAPPGGTMGAFGAPTLDTTGAFKSPDPADDGHHEGYSPGANPAASNTTNVCKVKPTQQVTGGAGGVQVVPGGSVVGGQQQHSSMVPHVLLGTPLSPPPAIPPVLGAGVGLGPQQYTAGQHLGYQTGHGNTQYGIPAIPSPPTVLYNSTQQQLQAAAAQTAGLYGAFQIDQLGGQGRSQFSQFPSYHSLGQAASSPYSAQSVYLPTAPPPHPPPTAQPPPDLYPNISSYRLSAAAAGPFGQSQQLSNPTTVLISSTSNSLMSASVKPSSQPISAIGTKAGGVGQAYQQQSAQQNPQQPVYMAYDPQLQANYLQRAAPQHSSVVQAQLQPNSSFYSGSTGAQTGYFQQQASSTLSQHQAAAGGYGLQTSVFGQSHSNPTAAALQGYNSHFLSTAVPVASALGAQFRSAAGMPGAAPAYMKGGDPQAGNTRPGPPTQEMLSSVFNSAPQIPSPKSRQNQKHPLPQSSPTSQRKYNLYQNVGNQQNNMQQRYPTPIQRPVNFQQQQQSLGVQQNNSVNQKHRNNANKTPNNRQYYGGQANSPLSAPNDKADEGKLSETGGGGGAKVAGTPATPSNGADIVKDNIKEETSTLKD